MPYCASSSATVCVSPRTANFDATYADCHCPPRCALNDPAADRPAFTADVPGQYVLRLVVNDGKTDSEPDTVAILAGWWLANFGFQLVMLFISENPAGNSMLTRLTFLSFPFHFWFTAQMLPLWFVILCVIYNLYMDKVSERHSRRRDRTYE